MAMAKNPSSPPGFFGKDQILILEEVHDPCNLGTILRCAEAFGIDEVHCVMRSAADRSYVRSSLGSMLRLNLSVMDSAAASISHCRRHGVHIIASTPLWQLGMRRTGYPLRCWRVLTLVCGSRCL